jgi:predicted nucleic acid-binding protein
VSLHWFPDNTVLCNFAAVDALTLLEQVLDGRGRWVEAIAHEAKQSARHLGEAQTCHVVLNWAAYAGSVWVTDDREAQVYARRRGITTRDTADLVSEALTYGYVDRSAGYQLLLDMRAAGRFLRVPDHRDRL